MKKLSKKKIEQIYKNGNHINGRLFKLIWHHEINQFETMDVVISIPKKYIKKAVDRNYIKRIIKESIRSYNLFKFKNEKINVILIYNKSIVSKFKDVKIDLLNLCTTINTRLNENN